MFEGHPGGQLAAVADGGPGLSERIERQLSGETTRRFQDLGTGFGLYIAREVVDSYGGDLTAVDSTATQRGPSSG